MARRMITKEEIEELKRSPYIESASPQMVKFTVDFKRMAYQELSEGKTLREVLKESGIRPEILGDSRIWSIAEKLRKQGKRKEGFEDQGRKERQRGQKTKEQTMAERIEQLEHELAYTRQEVEFLKKIQAADMEARKSWESRQRRK